MVNMIKRATIEDLEFIERVYYHPEINPHICDDFTKDNHIDIGILLKNQMIYFLIPYYENNGMGFFFAHPWNTICYEAHIAMLPEFRGSKVVEATKEAIKWGFENTICRKLITQVPVYNNRAFAVAIRAGGKIEGLNRSSIMRNGKLQHQYLIGFKKEG